MTPKVPKKSKKKIAAHPIVADTDDVSSLATELDQDIPNEKEAVLTAFVEQQKLQIATLTNEIAQLTVTNANNQSLIEQHTSIKAKLFETLNQNTLLRNDLKLAHKCIQREIGANVTLAAVASAKTSWHGRAEQISALQNKIIELKLQCNDGSGGGGGGGIAEADAKYQLRQVDSQRKIELDEVSKQLDMAKQDAEKQRYKLNAQRVRNANLQSEIMGYKQQLVAMQDKSHEDDRQIRMLTEQIDLKNCQKDRKIKKLHSKINFEQCRTTDLCTLNADLSDELATQTDENVALARRTDELNEKIKSLELELRRQCGDFLYNCRELRKTEYMAILDVLQFEKERLLVQLRSMDGRLRLERERQDGLHEQLRRQSTKYCRLECKYNECLKDIMALKERNRRSQRVAGYVRNAVSLVTSNTSVNSQVSVAPTPQESVEQFQCNYQITNLHNKLDIANERIVLLNERIKELAQEKIADMELFGETIARSKYVLVEHLVERKKHQLCQTAVTATLSICDDHHSSDELPELLFMTSMLTPKTPTKHVIDSV